MNDKKIRETSMRPRRTTSRGSIMKRMFLSVAFRLGLAMLALSPLTAASAQPAAQTPASAFETEVAAAKAAMMGDPETALKHARAATSLSRRQRDAAARQIGEATGNWLEGEALIRVNR